MTKYYKGDSVFAQIPPAVGDGAAPFPGHEAIVRRVNFDDTTGTAYYTISLKQSSSKEEDPTVESDKLTLNYAEFFDNRVSAKGLECGLGRG